MAACDAGGPDPESDVPRLRVVAIDVTTRQVDDSGETTGYVSTPLAIDGTTKPTTGTSIRVRLNRYLDPSTATRSAICVQSSTTDVTSPVECAGLLLRPSYDPVSRTVTYFLETDQTQLAPDTFYRVTLFRNEGDDGFGLRAFDGPALGGPFVLEFTTEAQHPEAPAPTDGPDTSINFCKPIRCLAACQPLPEDQVAACAETCTPGVEDALEGSCALGGCHRTTDGQPAPMGLDLHAPEGFQATAIARVAHGTARGAGAQNPDVAGIAFGRAMPIIAPGDPGNSYLLYKVLAHPGFDPPVEAPATQLAPGLEPGETERLRASVIVGSPMPPTSVASETAAATSTPLSIEYAARLSRWIAAGADTSRCGPPATLP